MKDQYGNAVPNDLMVLDWRMMIEPYVGTDVTQILDIIDRSNWYEVEHPTRGKWLCVDVNPDEMPNNFEFETLQAWDINLSICEVYLVNRILHRFGPEDGFYHA